MTIISKTALAATFTVVLASSAFAQSPQIPTPANPTPLNPIATDGSPLPTNAANLRTGRSVATTTDDVFTPLRSIFNR